MASVSKSEMSRVLAQYSWAMSRHSDHIYHCQCTICGLSSLRRKMGGLWAWSEHASSLIGPYVPGAMYSLRRLLNMEDGRSWEKDTNDRDRTKLRYLYEAVSDAERWMARHYVLKHGKSEIGQALLTRLMET